LGKLPFLAEDLGYITDEVTELRKKLEIPGMKVMQFGFGDRGAHTHLPHRLTPDSAVYTGTHDNDTTVGWWNSSATEVEKTLAANYLGICNSEGVHWAFIRGALTSVANLAIYPVQDVLGLGSEARMNVPSQPEGNWSWRLRAGQLTPQLAGKLATLVEVTDRDVCVKQPSPQAQPHDAKAGDPFAA